MSPTYASSPRPTFDGPSRIAARDVVRHTWGDAASGEVTDWIYVSSDSIHQIVFGLGAGSAFRHSDAFRTIFAADEILYVLAGTMAIANPATGEVHRIERGEAVFFHRDTWHHAFSLGPVPLRVLEFMSPPPSAGAAGTYARRQPLLEAARYELDAARGRWPVERADIEAQRTMTPVRDGDLLWRLIDGEEPALVGTLASTDELTVERLDLGGSQAMTPVRHDGDTAGYVVVGSVGLEPRDAGNRQWFELEADDGFFIPAGVPFRCRNLSDRPATVVWGIGVATHGG